MKNTEFAILWKEIQSQMPGFAMKGRLIVAVPLTQVLRGINFDPSGFGKRPFQVTALVMPLCDPSRHLNLNIGRRITRQDGRARWDADDPSVIHDLGTALKSQAIPFLSSAESLDGFVTLARSGNTGAAKEVLDQLRKELDLSVEWQNEMAKQVQSLEAVLVAAPDEAQLQLAAWENETTQNLGLEAFR